MTAQKLTSSPWSKALSGLFSRDHYLRVPLDRSGNGDKLPDGSSEITVYAREIVRRDAGLASKPEQLPALVFLQGGPGCEAPRPASDGGLGWLGAVTQHYRVFLLDQRGTGASTPIDNPLFGGSAAGTARILSHMRADEIVEDCEDLRRALGIERWSLLGQSFGGFCTVRYLSAHAESLDRVHITGGLPAVGRSIADVYRLTYAAMREKSLAHYARFPEDRERMTRLVELADAGELRTAAGEAVGRERLRSLGSLLGASGGSDQLHFLLERDPASGAFQWELPQHLAFDGRFPLYTVIHESCWADGEVTGWAAARVRPAEFADDPTLLTGEHVLPEFLEEDAALAPWREVAEIVAGWEWPRLYSEDALRAADVAGAAAVYARDVYVPVETSLETAALLPRLHAWVTSEFEHNGSRASGGDVFRRLHELAGGNALR